MTANQSIEKFIRENRPAFDGTLPGAHGWKGVEKILQRFEGADALERTLLLNRVLLDTATPSDGVWAGIERALPGADCAGGDALERFICDNRDEFDHAVPDLRVWAGIENEVPAAPTAKLPVKRVSITWYRPLLRAAAAVALLVAGIGMGIWYAGSRQPTEMAMGQISSEYAELEQYYQQDISGKQVKLANFAGNQPAEVYDDLKALDQVMNELKLELADVPAGNREQVVRAMIENYRAKAAILQRVLERLEQANPENLNSKQNHETENI
jgi:hypothetical protein